MTVENSVLRVLACNLDATRAQRHMRAQFARQTCRLRRRAAKCQTTPTLAIRLHFGNVRLGEGFYVLHDVAELEL